ncbi:MAG: glycosyltransferase [Actinomycetota bacterium]
MRFLFSVLPAVGHWQPMAALGRATQAAGHEVLVATGATFRPWVEASGFEFKAAGLDLFGSDWWAAGCTIEPGPRSVMVDGVDSGTAFSRFIVSRHGPQMVQDLVGLIASWGPDCLIHDSQECGGEVAATLTALPHAVMGVTCLLPGYASTTADLLERCGLPRCETAQFLCLDRAPPGFLGGASPWEPTRQALRPVSADDASPLPPDPSWRRCIAPRPTAYVTLGTTYNGRPGVFEAIIEALGGQDLTVVITTGPGKDPATLGELPDNVVALPYTPQSTILCHADIVVTHGGFNSMMGALAFGRPQVVLPLGADHFFNAERLADCGAGIVVQLAASGGYQPEPILQAVEQVLTKNRYRAAAQRLGDEIAAMPGLETGVHLLERLAAERRPIV